MLYKYGFKKMNSSEKFNSTGDCYELNPKLGKGNYWIYSYKDLFSVTIHDFFFYEDFYLEYKLPEYFSLSYYESVSGEEFNPYTRLSAGCVRSYLFGSKKYQAIFHKNIPIKSIDIEFTPKYLDKYLEMKYEEDYVNPREALLGLRETKELPEIEHILYQIKSYRGSGMSAKLFYESKVLEAISLVISFENNGQNKKSSLSQMDAEQLQNVASYIKDHFAHNLRLDKLSKIACMSLTKLKKTFKQEFNCTITGYIQNQRMGHAEHLLSNTSFSIGEISRIVGYKSTSRFSQLFKRTTGLKPKEFRKLAKKKDDTA